MKKRILPILALSAIALGACNGTKKVDYETFKKAALSAELEKAPKLKKVVYNGYAVVDGEKYKVTFLKVTEDMDKDKLTGEQKKFLASAGIASEYSPTLVAKDDSATYYVENGFRYVKDKETISWDQYCNVTKMKTTLNKIEFNFTVSYTYEK